MENIDELKLYEQFVFEKLFYGSENLSVEECYFYFQMLRQTKDISDSKHTLNENDPTRFELLSMSLRSNDQEISFNGNISNGVEDKALIGVIKKSGKKYFVVTEVSRLHPSVSEDIKTYYVYDTFNLSKGYRQSVYDEPAEYREKYGESEIYEEFISGIDMDSFEDFKTNIIGKKRI